MEKINSDVPRGSQSYQWIYSCNPLPVGGVVGEESHVLVGPPQLPDDDRVSDDH